MNGGPAVAEGYGGQATEMPIAGNRKSEIRMGFPEFPELPVRIKYCVPNGGEISR